jgi:hypothetical protein
MTEEAEGRNALEKRKNFEKNGFKRLKLRVGCDGQL